MEHPRTLISILIGLFVHFLILTDTENTGVHCHDDMTRSENENIRIGWIFGDERFKRSPTDEQTDHFIEDRKCRDDLKRLCGATDNNNDDLFILECAQTFKVCN